MTSLQVELESKERSIYTSAGFICRDRARLTGGVRNVFPIPKWLADWGLSLNRTYYKQLLDRKWFTESPPSWFDHRIDLHYLWPDNLFWLERGILPRKLMKEGCVVLDLFCGDGFYSRYFYSSIASAVDAIDKDPNVIEHASSLHAHEKIKFKISDIMTDPFPREHYDLVVWFEAIEHLSEDQYASAVRKIKNAIGDTGVLFGSTPIFKPEQMGHANWEHQNEFSSVEQLEAFLCRDFRSVYIDVTWYPTWNGGERRTAYFTVRNPKAGRRHVESPS